MKPQRSRSRLLGFAALFCVSALFALAAQAATKNMAVVVSAGSKLQDVPLAELAKLSKGAQKNWPDGRSFTLIMKAPESPEMRIVVQKLFGMPPNELKAAMPKLNETRQVIKIVETDEDLLHTVEATPGSVGVLDVYAINSSVKVLRVDGKLPFDVGYALKGN
jgi:ABC-type phosphate transport system substrate-binding protein